MQVRIDKEFRKESKVGNVDDDSGIETRVGDVTGVAHRFGVISVECDECSHHHLQYLRDRNRHGKLAWNSHSQRPECIVAVHDRMDHVVHIAVPSASGRFVRIAIPGEDEHRGMVVVVQEDQFLFPKNHKHCVD